MDGVMDEDDLSLKMLQEIHALSDVLVMICSSIREIDRTQAEALALSLKSLSSTKTTRAFSSLCIILSEALSGRQDLPCLSAKRVSGEAEVCRPPLRLIPGAPTPHESD